MRRNRVRMSSKWVGEGKMDLNVQAGMIDNGELDDCLVPAAQRHTEAT